MRLFAILLFFVLFAAPAHAQAPQQNHAAPRLFSAVKGTGDGGWVEIGLYMKLEKDWDIYWRMPGDAGLAPVLDWTGSRNFKSYKMYWPAPQRMTVAGLDNNIYKEEVTFPITVTLENPGAALDLKLHLDLLVCSSEMCVPEKHDLTLSIPAGYAHHPSEDADLYAEAIKAVPLKNADTFSPVRAWLDFDKSNKNYLVAEAVTTKKPSARADVFVEHPSYTAFGAPAIVYNDKTKTMTLRMEAHSNESMDDLKKTLGDGGFTLTFVDGKTAAEGGVALGPKPDDAPEVRAPLALKEKMEGIGLSLLLAALLGGLILNLMPCVLPVLSLKILSVVSHGGKNNGDTIFRNFMASAFGILCSFWLMAGILAALKSAGGAVGWGIQFQNPVFLVFLITVVLLFAANMWGLFEIPLPRFIAKHIASKHEHEPTLAGHFLTGAFATLLATPCTAPFLGTAVGFALARGTFEIMTIFTFLGLGLALPYIALAVSPGLFRFMPKPGAWMVKLKKFLALALLVTALWLGHVLLTISTTPALDAGWKKFDTALIGPAVAEGKTVVVDVTADWCLTCKANKKFVLETTEMKEALSAPNILRLQADWTTRDESIAAYLKRFGRYGIPFNIVYGPAAPEGIPLPELLSKKAVLDAIAEAAGE